MLRSWSAAPPATLPPFARPISLLLAALNVLTGLGWAALDLGPRPFILAAALAGAWALVVHARVEQTLRAAQRPGRDLALLGAVLARLERERFTAPLLVSLRASLDSDGVSPSAQVRRLARLQEYLDSRLNQLFAPFALLLLWSTQLGAGDRGVAHPRGAAGTRVAGRRGRVRGAVRARRLRLRAPGGPVPGARGGRAGRSTGSGLGHPLIPRAACVRNDVRLDRELRLLLVSGSNMSGKSTLLRTVGLNAVLALAGAPVRASSLRLSPLSVGASIRIQDSLQQGASRFYAEITRLRADRRPGPGSTAAALPARRDPARHQLHDRRIGAEAIVRGLLQRGAIGLVTTHDLALARIVDDLAPQARNVHFEDHLEDGRVAFDYRLKDGVVTRSNAIALMRAVGLEV